MFILKQKYFYAYVKHALETNVKYIVSNARFTYTQYILDLYVATTYYTFYLHNLVNKFVTQKMQFMLKNVNMIKHEYLNE